MLERLRDDGVVGWRVRWGEWSWRVRLGWVLLGLALLVASVALPVFGLAGGDLNAVAGWANILALPVSALGLVFVVADRAAARLTGRATSTVVV